MTDRGETFRVAFGAAFLSVALALGGCVSVPARTAVHSSLTGEMPLLDMACSDFESPALPGPARVVGTLDHRHIAVLSWNVHKARHKGWSNDFRRIGQDRDLLLIQEARLSVQLRDLIGELGYHWNMVPAFQRASGVAGVMTASSVSPLAVCAQRATEPWIKLPKSALIARYALSGRQQSVAVANIHAINFAFGTRDFEAQLMQLIRPLRHHEGPIILGGDFNTWSGARQRALERILAPLSLRQVRFDSEDTKRVFGHELDRIYYRGLEIVDFETIPVESSDHNPLRITFSTER